MKNPRTKRILLACVLAAGILFLALLCFYHLDYGELMDWDEARHGVSAYEMLQTGEPIVTTYAYSPDYWNLKPPLSEWLIALGYKLFGYNAYGLRFFSGVSMFLSTLLCAAFLWKRYGKTEAVFSLFAFASCGKLFYYHAARNGDADALFIFATRSPSSACAKATGNFHGLTALALHSRLPSSQKAGTPGPSRCSSC